MTTRLFPGLLLLTTTVLVGPACGLFGIFGKATEANMDKWEVQKMTVDIRQEQKAICPGQNVQLAVFADAKHKKRKDKTKQLQTANGTAELGRMGKMGFDEFKFETTDGTIDEKGFFHANPDVVATVDGFEIRTTYLRAPEKFAFVNEYKPTYDCMTQSGAVGAGGDGGSSGVSGDNGQMGSGGSSDRGGSDGGDGAPGGPGGDGRDGGAGPAVVAYATMVKTSLHDRLVMVKVTGGTEDVVLFHPENRFVISAAGGMGGPGGSGGSGGNGGAGGSVTLIYDAAFPELANMISLDASGGPGGPAGSPGSAGNAGSKGSALGEGATSGASGTGGTQGAEGTSGQDGPAGVVEARAEDVSEAFAFLPDNIDRLE